MVGMDRIGTLAQKQVFRIGVQREFMSHDLGDEHDKEKEKQWVLQNATPFAVWFKRENQNGRLEKEIASATKDDKKGLIDTWLTEMKQFARSDEYKNMSETEKEAA